MAEPAVAGAGPFLRFLLSGAFNTLVTYGLYLALLQWLSYGWSYTLAYAAGIGLGYLLQRFFVFRRPGGRAAPLLVGLVYGLQYLLGLAAVWCWTSALALPAPLAPLFAVALTVPLGFVLGGRVFRGVPSAR